MSKSSRFQAEGTATILACAALLQACAASTDASVAQGSTQSRSEGGQCFLPQQVNNFDAVDNNTIYVTVGTEDMFRMDIVGTCPDVDWSQQIGIASRGGGSWVCGGLDADIIVPSPTGTQRCPVTNITKLTEAEVQARRETRRP